MMENLLKILSSAPDKTHSDEHLAAELGVSPEDVRRQIDKLLELGYEIIASPEGRRLAGSADAPYPWEFLGRRSKIHYFPKLESTMEKAKELAFQGCPDFTLVIAEKQSKGRGRLGRDWRSEKGGLYFTLVLRPNAEPALMSRISFAASLSLAQTLRNLIGVDARIKWPNDILIQEKKVSGMLCEMVVEGDKISYLNIGVGLNVNNDPPKLDAQYAAVSLKQILGKETSRKMILAGFLDALEDRINNSPLDHSIVDEWKKYTVSLNRRVKISLQNEVVTGRALDVDDFGALILEKEDKSIKKIFFGDCFHLA